MNFAIALSILAAVAVGCEWWLRRKERHRLKAKASAEEALEAPPAPDAYHPERPQYAESMEEEGPQPKKRPWHKLRRLTWCVVVFAETFVL